ncbi:MAG: DNA-binding protein Alba, partial [Promethearchaeota archaeon]
METNTVYVGKKPVMTYVMAIITAMKDQGGVTIKARGRSISTAVDAAEITRNRYLPGLTNTVAIDTEEMETEDGGTRNVSTIAITLRKSPEAE